MNFIQRQTPKLVIVRYSVWVTNATLTPPNATFLQLSSVYSHKSRESALKYAMPTRLILIHNNNFISYDFTLFAVIKYN